MDTTNLTPQPYLCEEEKSEIMAESNKMPCSIHKPSEIDLNHQYESDTYKVQINSLKSLQRVVIPLKLTKDIYHSLPIDSKVLLSSIADKLERIAGSTSIESNGEILKNNLDTLKTSGLVDVIQCIGSINHVITSISEQSDHCGNNIGSYGAVKKALTYCYGSKVSQSDSYEINTIRFKLPESFHCEDSSAFDSMEDKLVKDMEFFVNPFEYLHSFTLYEDEDSNILIKLKNSLKNSSYVNCHDDDVNLSTLKDKLPMFCLLSSIIAEYKNVAYLYAVNIQNEDGSHNDDPQTFYTEENTFFNVFKERLLLNSKPLEGFQLNDSLQVILSENTNPDGISKCFNIINNIEYHTAFTGDHLIYSTLASNTIEDMEVFINSVNAMRQIHYANIVEPALNDCKSFVEFFNALSKHIHTFNADHIFSDHKFEGLASPDYTNNIVQHTVIDKDLHIVHNVTSNGISVGDFQKNYYL